MISEETTVEEHAKTFTRARLKSLALVTLTITLAGIGLLMVWPFLPAVTWALALAVIGEPLRRQIAQRVPWPAASAGIAVATVAVLLAAPVGFVSYQLVAQAKQSAGNLQALPANAIEKPIESLAKTNHRLGAAIDWLRNHVDLEGEMTSAVSWLSRSTPTFITGTSWIVMQFLIMLLVLFYFFRDHSQILQSVRRLLPLTTEESEALFQRVDDAVHATIFGSLLVAVLQGTLGGLMFWWLGLPTPLLWGVVMSLFAVIPNLGTFVIWAPAALILGLQGQWGKAALLAGWGVTAIGLIDNLTYPILVGNRLRLHPLLIFFSVLGGLGLFGVSGIVIGPVSVALLLALLDIWRVRTSAAPAADEMTLPGQPAANEPRSGNGKVGTAQPAEAT